MIVVFAENLRDAGVVEVERVPEAAAVVGFGLDVDCFGGELFELPNRSSSLS